MGDKWIRFRLETFQIRLKLAGKLSKFFEFLKDQLNPRRNKRLRRTLAKISKFFKKRRNAIIENKRDWAERIHLGKDFIVHD